MSNLISVKVICSKPMDKNEEIKLAEISLIPKKDTSNGLGSLIIINTNNKPTKTYVLQQHCVKEEGILSPKKRLADTELNVVSTLDRFSKYWFSMSSICDKLVTVTPPNLVQLHFLKTQFEHRFALSILEAYLMDRCSVHLNRTLHYQRQRPLHRVDYFLVYLELTSE